MGNARKLGRLFKYLNEYQKLLNALDSDAPAWKQSLEVFNRFTMGMYWYARLCHCVDAAEYHDIIYYYCIRYGQVL